MNVVIPLCNETLPEAHVIISVVRSCRWLFAFRQLVIDVNSIMTTAYVFALTSPPKVWTLMQTGPSPFGVLETSAVYEIESYLPAG
jgi:hypothetical protein